MATNRLFSIYLLREASVAAGNFLDSDRDVDAHPIKVAGRRIGELHVGSPVTKVPRWRSLFEAALPGKLNRIMNSTTSAVLIVPAGGRTFALTFGYGRFLLAPGSWEEGFGLKATLNAVDPRAIRSIDKKSFDALVSHTRTQGSREGTPLQLGINAEKDLLRAVTGKPVDGSLGKRLAGMDALSAAVDAELSDLPDLLERYLQKSAETGYRKAFPWVDQIREIRDVDRQQHLDSSLVGRLRAGQFTKIWMAVPEMVEWVDVDGFVYRAGKSETVHRDLDIKDFLAGIDPSTVAVDDLRRARVFQVNAADGARVKKWTVYQCLYSEMTEGAKEFVLSNGRWYEVDANYVQNVNSSVGAIPDSSISLPDYDDPDERSYNERLTRDHPDRFFLMDRDLIRHGGNHSSFEFCDVVSAQRQLVHVKNYGGSAVLSHLFAQGLNSAKLFLRDSSFRTKLSTKLPAGVGADFPTTRPDPSKFEVVYAIVSDSESPIKDSLPFFSRMTLHSAATELLMLGFGLSIAKIRDRAAAHQKAA